MRLTCCNYLGRTEQTALPRPERKRREALPLLSRGPSRVWLSSQVPSRSPDGPGQAVEYALGAGVIRSATRGAGRRGTSLPRRVGSEATSPGAQRATIKAGLYAGRPEQSSLHDRDRRGYAPTQDRGCCTRTERWEVEMNGRTGTSLGGSEKSPRWLEKQRKRREREEQRWAKLSGPLTVTWVDPSALREQPPSS